MACGYLKMLKSPARSLMLDYIVSNGEGNITGISVLLKLICVVLAYAINLPKKSR